MAKTDKTMLSDAALEAFFVAGRAEAPEPGPALMARILADAEAEIAARRAGAGARRRARRASGPACWSAASAAGRRWPAWRRRRWPGSGSGFASPDQVNALAGGLLLPDERDERRRATSSRTSCRATAASRASPRRCRDDRGQTETDDARRAQRPALAAGCCWRLSLTPQRAGAERRSPARMFRDGRDDRAARARRPTAAMLRDRRLHAVLRRDAARGAASGWARRFAAPRRAGPAVLAADFRDVARCASPSTR